ncbi:MAG: MFS transporter, partial [Candidatus Aminicenantales bacterium]
MTKPKALALLSLTELLGMSVWFSASAVVPALTAAWGLSASSQAWLTMSVQLGFVAGAMGSALLNLADRISGRWLFALSSVCAGVATLLIPMADRGVFSVLSFRFMTGVFLAGVYPVGMKIMATWTREDRGFGVGLLVGALTLGSAAPHLIKAFGQIGDWRPVLEASGALAVLGGLVAAAFVREGPYRTAVPKFDWKFVGTLWRDRPVALANVGYFGHMWELYAAWTWVPVFLVASFRHSALDERWAALAGFAFIAVGAAGSLVAGKLADRIGRTAVTSAAMAMSGACSLVA